MLRPSICGGEFDYAVKEFAEGCRWMGFWERRIARMGQWPITQTGRSFKTLIPCRM
jgi:hypothetical protein